MLAYFQEQIKFNRYISFSQFVNSRLCSLTADYYHLDGRHSSMRLIPPVFVCHNRTSLTCGHPLPVKLVIIHCNHFAHVFFFYWLTQVTTHLCFSCWKRLLMVNDKRNLHAKHKVVKGLCYDLNN